MEEKEIRGRTYTCDVLPFGEATKVLTAFTKLTGKGIAQMGEGHVAEGVGGIIERLAHDDLVWFADRFGAVSKCGDIQLTKNGRETAFKGRVLDFFEWLTWCFQVNFDDLFTEVGSLMSGLGGPQQSTENEPPPSDAE